MMSIRWILSGKQGNGLNLKVRAGYYWVPRYCMSLHLLEGVLKQGLSGYGDLDVLRCGQLLKEIKCAFSYNMIQIVS